MLFDLDGTLIDSVYQHVLAWREALEKAGVELSAWRIQRRIGMSGGLFVQALIQETGRRFSSTEALVQRRAHIKSYLRLCKEVRPLTGARKLLKHLTRVKVPWAIATTGRIEGAKFAMKLLDVPNHVPVVTRDQVRHAKPDPDLFLEAANRLGVDIHSAIVVGDRTQPSMYCLLI